MVRVDRTFRELITDEMAQRGLTRGTFAQLVGVSKTMVSHWVNPDRVMREAPELVTIRKVSRALGIGEWELWLAVGRQLGLSVHATPGQLTVITSGQRTPGQVEEIRNDAERALGDRPAPIDRE